MVTDDGTRDMNAQDSFIAPLGLVLSGVPLIAIGGAMLGPDSSDLWFWLMYVGGTVSLYGFRLCVKVLVNSIGDVHVPSWLGFLILFTILAAALIPLLISEFQAS